MEVLVCLTYNVLLYHFVSFLYHSYEIKSKRLHSTQYIEIEMENHRFQEKDSEHYCWRLRKKKR